MKINKPHPWEKFHKGMTITYIQDGKKRIGGVVSQVWTEMVHNMFRLLVINNRGDFNTILYQEGKPNKVYKSIRIVK